MMRLLILVVCSITLIQAAFTPNQPSTYFGGTNVEAYLNWEQAYGDAYQQSTFLNKNEDEGVAVHWSIVENKTLHIAVAARATGWVGFGISENGGMLGADVVLFQANKPDQLQDSHILDVRNPIPDDCQNWKLVRSVVDGGFLIFEATRPLDTLDRQDRKIINDSELLMPKHRVIAAWDDTNEVLYHGENRVRGAIRFFGDASNNFLDEMERQTYTGTFELRSQNYSIKEIETEYIDICISWSELLENAGTPNADPEDVFIIGFEPIIDQTEHVHHFTLHGGLEDTTTCERLSQLEFMYGWAPGEGPLALPDFLGTRIGGTNGFKSLRLEIHYDNPNFKSGLLDSSGIRFYYTTEPREYEMGVLSLADPAVRLGGDTVQKGLSEFSFYCPESCSLFTAKEPVTVIREMLHMHQSGVSGFIDQIRGGEVVHRGSVDFFNFHQQGSQMIVQDPYTLAPGDAFRTNCYYKNTEERQFGTASSDEMCIAYLMYYPRQTLFDQYPWVCAIDHPLDQCKVQVSESIVGELSLFERQFGRSGSQCVLDERDPGESSSRYLSFTLPLLLIFASMVVGAKM